MNCNDLHKKLIFFIEAELPKEEMQKIQLHLNKCEECSLFLDDMKKTLGTIEADKIQTADPFFYTRLKARMENENEPQIGFNKQPILIRILQPALFTILLLAGIYGGYKIGGTEATYKSAAVETQDMIPYLDEMKSEVLETFLME
ncbi:MAG: zf-HC2 domain-containing protein [Prolixibacteraceae bacterium]|nr:zf-HC2 domain-containing protein [Prolixibacteraceae bacterium]